MDDFARVMASRTDVELLDVLASAEGTYRPEALESARTEAARRRLPVTAVASRSAEREAEHAERAAEAPGAGWLLAAVFFPVPFLVLALITIPAYERDGYARTAAMLRKMVRVIAIILAVVVAAVAARLAR